MDYIDSFLVVAFSLVEGNVALHFALSIWYWMGFFFL